MIGRRYPASSSFVLAAPRRAAAPGAPAWLRPRDGANPQPRGKPQEQSALSPRAPKASSRASSPRPL